jgi:hypothetical protein
MIFLIKQKVLNPCEISINTNIQGSYFIYFSHSKILGCDRLPPLKEISSRDLERLERNIGLEG